MENKFWTWFWKVLYPWFTNEFVPYLTEEIAKANNRENGSVKPEDKPGVPPPPPVPPQPPQ